VNHQYAGKYDDAITFYKKALALNPNEINATYNLAAVYYAKKDPKTARPYIEKILGKYEDSSLNADTYALHGMILTELKDHERAEKSLDQALKIKRWHAEAFSTLLTVYRQTRQNDKYIQRVQDFIALDYGNTYTFNAYIDFLQQTQQTEPDRKIEKHLLALKLTDAQQNGALYFNLGRWADMNNDKPEALRRYRLSLASLQTLKNPPEGAIPGLTQRIRELSVPGGK